MRWIKSWVPYNVPTQAWVHQVGAGNRLRIQLLAPESAPVADPVTKSRVVTRARRLRRVPKAERRRRLYAGWERDPNLRSIALAAWGATCQVTGCTFLVGIPAHIRSNMVDVHHLNHVAKGGTDSPLNICVLCVVHHQLIHRAPTSVLQSWNLDGSTVIVNGLTLAIVRDARAIL